MDRYSRNMNSITKEECEILHSKKVCVIGCGGLGGYVIELLARLGVLHITGVDYDVFDETNLNRQIFSTTDNLGKSKALEAKKRIKSVNPDVNFTAVCDKFSNENAISIINGHDLVIDACDKISTRLLLEDTCNNLSIPLIHGAISGWYGQVSVIMPGDNTLEKIYGGADDSSINSTLGNPSFTPPIVASMEVCEAVKVLLNKGVTLKSKLLSLDLLNNSYEVFTL